MISGYFGQTGSGKSYSVVANVILPALKKGRAVYTNIPLTDKCDGLGGSIHPFDNEVERPYFSTIPAGALVVMDESWRYCASGTRTSSIEKEFLSFFKEHRHRVDEDGINQDIVIVTQDNSDLCTFLKSSIQTAYYITKKQAGKIKQFRTEVYTGKDCAMMRSKPDRSFFTSYDSDVFPYYKSATFSDSGQVGLEDITDDRANIFNSWIIKYGIPISILGVIFGLYFIINSFGALTDVKQESIKQDKQNHESLSPKGHTQNVSSEIPKVIDVVTESPVPEIPLSKDFRVDGYMKIFDEEYVLLVDNRSNHYKVNPSLCNQTIVGWECVYNGHLITPRSGHRMEFGGMPVQIPTATNFDNQ